MHFVHQIMHRARFSFRRWEVRRGSAIADCINISWNLLITYSKYRDNITKKTLVWNKRRTSSKWPKVEWQTIFLIQLLFTKHSCKIRCLSHQLKYFPLYPLHYYDYNKMNERFYLARFCLLERGITLAYFIIVM